MKVVYKWKRQLLENAGWAFEAESGDGGRLEREEVLLKKTGELAVDHDFLSRGLARFR